MKKLREKEEELLDILNRGGVHTTHKIAKEMRIDEPRVRTLIKAIRNKFINYNLGDYIYTAPNGYTTEESKENTIYESNMRMKIGFGVLLNGSFVFRRAKRIALKEFKGLTIQYKPLATQKLIGGN
jgi:hypothetical protein